ncbi:MAG: hypothetical protein IJK23_06640 [Clostridia bacterium]|nr:hypothetical protein [Clostridia bacterium]
MSDETVNPVKRIPSIDRFRGFVIFCMIVFQFAEHFPSPRRSRSRRIC